MWALEPLEGIRVREMVFFSPLPQWIRSSISFLEILVPRWVPAGPEKWPPFLLSFNGWDPASVFCRLWFRDEFQHVETVFHCVLEFLEDTRPRGIAPFLLPLNGSGSASVFCRLWFPYIMKMSSNMWKQFSMVPFCFSFYSMSSCLHSHISLPNFFPFSLMFPDFFLFFSVVTYIKKKKTSPKIMGPGAPWKYHAQQDYPLFSPISTMRPSISFLQILVPIHFHEDVFLNVETVFHGVFLCFFLYVEERRVRLLHVWAWRVAIFGSFFFFKVNC